MARLERRRVGGWPVFPTSGATARRGGVARLEIGDENVTRNAVNVLGVSDGQEHAIA